MTENRGTVEDADYVFRYRLRAEGEEAKAPYFQDRLLEMLRQQLENLLNVVVLVHHGQEVRVDGFKLLSDLDTTYEIFQKEELRRSGP